MNRLVDNKEMLDILTDRDFWTLVWVGVGVILAVVVINYWHTFTPQAG